MTAPSDGEKREEYLANRAVPHMRQSQYWTPIGVRPHGWAGSGGGFDRMPGVLILELLRAQISERRV